MTLFSDRDERVIENLRIINSRFIRKDYKVVRGERVTPPGAGGGGTPTVTIAAYNATQMSKDKADFTCTGISDESTFALAFAVLAGSNDDAGNIIGGRIVLTEGDYYLSSTIQLNKGVRIEGMGQDATHLHSAFSADLVGATNVNMFHVDHTPGVGSFDPISISHLDMNGHKAIQTSGSPSGIYCEPNGGSDITLEDISVHDFRGWGMFFDRCADEVSAFGCRVYSNTLSGVEIVREGTFQFTNCYVGLNGQHGFEAPGAQITMLGCRVVGNTWEGFSSGGILQQAGQIIVGNHFVQNRTAITLDGYEAIIADNFIISNVDGLSLAANRPMTVSGNSIHGNTGIGMILTGGAGNLGALVTGNVVSGNGQHGIVINSSYWHVIGNKIYNNGTAANNTYDGIQIAAGSHAAVLTNSIRQMAAANRMRYGVNITAGATSPKVAGNDFGDPAAYGTGALADAGTGTEKTWPNDGFYGDNYTLPGQPGVPDEPVGGPDDTTAPAVPTGLNAEPGDTEIFLDWNDNEELDLASYELYRAPDVAGVPGTFVFLASVVDISQYTDTGLSNGTQYWYRLTAKDTTGNESAPTANVSETPAVPAVGVAPPVPTGLTVVTAGDAHVDLSWESGGFASDFSHYNVYFATVTGGPYTLFGTRTVTNASVTDLTNATPYFFVVTAEDLTANESAESNEVTDTPTADTPPVGLPAIDVIFDSGNPYSAAAVNAEAAGTVFQFTVTGGTGGGARYENASIPTKAGNQYVFDAGTILDGNMSTVLAFARGVNDVKIYDCEFTAYQGQNASGVNNTKGAAAIRLDDGWELIRPNGHHNKYSAVSFDGNDAHVLDGRLSYNGEFGFKGGGGPTQSFTGCWIDGTEVDHNGGGVGLDLRGDQGGCKVVHSIGFQFLNVYSHDNYGSGGAASIGTQGGNGLWTDINNIGTVYDNCVLERNRGAGIFHEVSLSFEIKNCTFENNGRDYAAANPGSLWPVSSQIQISNSGGTLGWIHDNTLVVDGSVAGLGFHGITMFNSQHFQWTNGVISNGCLGTRNLLVENNTITMSGANWKSAMAITGTLPTSRSGDQFCGQQEITAAGSNNRIRNNTESLSDGANLSTPYFRSGTRVTAAQWASFGYS